MNYETKKETTDAIELLKQMHAMHDTIYEKLLEGRRMSRAAKIEDVIDYIHVVRQIKKLVKSLLTEMNAAEKMLERVGCLKFATKGSVDKVRAQFAFGWPDPKPVPMLPRMSTDPEAYNALLESVGVSPDSLAVKQQMVRFSWDDVQLYISECVAKGEDPKIEQSDVQTQSIVRTRPKPGVNVLDSLTESKDD